MTANSRSQHLHTMIQNQINGEDTSAQNNGISSFPRKLHAMLEEASKTNSEDVVSWQPGGKSFKVHKPPQFADEIMNNYFNQTKYKSFQRQLNMYGFQRVHHGPNKGGYYHKSFIRRSPDLCDLIVRRPPAIHGEFSDEMAGGSNKGDLADPISLIDDCSEAFSENNGLKLHDSEVKIFYDFFFSKERDGEKVPAARIFGQGAADDDNDDNNKDDSSNASTIESIDRVFQEFSFENDGALASENASFPWKLHIMLERAETENYQDVVSWVPVKNGSAFRVHKPDEFINRVMPLYFDQTKFESFRRQLNMYGFSRVIRGEDRGIISHSNFIQGDRNMCKSIKRLK